MKVFEKGCSVFMQAPLFILLHYTPKGVFLCGCFFLCATFGGTVHGGENFCFWGKAGATWRIGVFLRKMRFVSANDEKKQKAVCGSENGGG